MKIILAEYLGFCYGVKRAIKIAREHADGKSCTLGPIIHNPQMVERLKSEGVGAVENLSSMREGTIIIRSHGVGPQVYEEAAGKGLHIVDATCPHVKKAQLSAKKLVEEGYQVVIVGEKNHPEVKSIFEWSNQKAFIVETEDEAKQLSSCQKLGIVSQTTVSSERFKKIVDLLCESKCKTYRIETAAELSPEWLNQIEKIGITAGASTPDWIIWEVHRKCQTILNE